MIDSDDKGAGPFLPTGTKVRYDGLVDGGPEVGIVLHCWDDNELEVHDCYVAFFGKNFPVGEPTDRPYVLRCASLSLVVLEGASTSS